MNLNTVQEIESANAALTPEQLESMILASREDRITVLMWCFMPSGIPRTAAEEVCAAAR
jgi:hypothetical protein